MNLQIEQVNSLEKEAENWIKFVIQGEPVGKGRPRFGNGRAYTPEKTREYENLIRQEYRLFHKSFSFGGGVPIKLVVKAFHSIPKSANKRTKALMANRLIRPLKKPDFDNIGKIVADALNGFAYDDDCQVVESKIEKYYAEKARVEVMVIRL